MLTVVQRGGATREKPPEAVRGQSSRLPWAWDGLCFGVPFNDATRDSARDLVANAAPSAWVGSPGWTTDNRGNVAASTATSGSYFEYPNNPAHNKPTTAMTAYVRFRRLGAPTLSSGLCCKVISTTAPWDTWWIGATDADSTELGGAIAVGGTNYYWVNLNYLTDGTSWISVFLRWRSGESPVQDVLGERGQTLSSTPYGAPLTGTLSYGSSQPIRISCGEDPAVGTYTAAISQVMLWSRRLTDVELQAIVADPYGWYSPRRETIGISSPYPLAFGGGEMRFGTGSGGLR